MGGKRKTLDDKIAEIDAKIAALNAKKQDLQSQKTAAARATKMREVADAIESGNDAEAARLMAEARAIGASKSDDAVATDAD